MIIFLYGFIEVKFRCRLISVTISHWFSGGFQILNQEPIQHSFVYSSLLLVISWLFESGCGSAAPAIDGNSFRPAEQIQVRSTESGSLIKGTQHETSRWASFEQKLYIRSMLFWHDSDMWKCLHQALIGWVVQQLFETFICLVRKNLGCGHGKKQQKLVNEVMSYAGSQPQRRYS